MKAPTQPYQAYRDAEDLSTPSREVPWSAFRPDDLRKLSLYLEAVDRDVREPHERRTIGGLRCATQPTVRRRPKGAKEDET